MMDKICPLSFIGREMGVPVRSCVKQQCMLWDNENNTCGIVTKILEVIK